MERSAAGLGREIDSIVAIGALLLVDWGRALGLTAAQDASVSIG